MSAKKFKFVSPGVFLSEIDNSQLPKLPGGIGPAIIGRTRRGPAMKPVKVSSFQEFVEIFGEPVPGNEGEDPWRDGNGLLAPAYAPYAAQAYLKADINSPVTVVRLLGVQGDDASDAGQAGWTAGTAFGIFGANVLSGSQTHGLTGSLLGIIYGTDTGDNSAASHLQVAAQGTVFNVDAGSPNTATTTANFASGSNATTAITVTNDKFTLAIKDPSLGTVTKEVSFKEGSNYIRDKLNTNPVATNTSISTIVSGTLNHKYWLGETFEEAYEELARDRLKARADAKTCVFIMQLDSGMADFKSGQHQLSEASSGWVIPQYTGVNTEFGLERKVGQEKLFRFHSVQEGEQGNDLYVCIENIKIAEDGDPSPFGRFDVVVKQKRADRIYEVDSFVNLSLNPNSDNFIARKIGDQYFEWDPVQKRNKVYGSYPNRSSYIRVEMGGEVGENGPDNPKSVPFGYLGPIKPASIVCTVNAAGTGSVAASKWVRQSAKVVISGSASDELTLTWPSVPHVTTGSTGIDLQAKYVMGHTPYNRKAGTNDISYASVNKGMKDFLRRGSSYASSAVITDHIKGTSGNSTEHAYVFTLDEIIISGSDSANVADLSSFQPVSVEFKTGSHAAGTAYTALSNGTSRGILDVVDSFSIPLAGGFDGVDITEADPFNMSTRTVSGKTTRTSYAYASIDRAIELIKDPEVLEMNLACMPGITNASLTTKLVQTCEARADALAIIDLPDVYISPAEKKCTKFKERIGTTPAKSAKALVNRQINSSYGATYYPWVKIRDTINSRDVWAPPSVIALGVMGYTEQRDEVWFAPAGFNRGGLNEGNAGMPVLQVSEQLLSSQRDRLYEANINPIASFVSEGLVVFGQKTLQMTPSALDRINVRRLLIFVKKEVSRIANGLLFDQNVPATWNRFTGQIVPFLESVKTRLGLTDFKVVLDKSTTTADLIDRNIMYAKIFLKPARAIEFIAVDFVITRTGASFDD